MKKALGSAAWKLGFAYMRRRYARRLRIVALLAILSLLAAGYVASRSRSSPYPDVAPQPPV